MKIIDGPLYQHQRTAFPSALALFIGILKAIKYDNFVISSRLNLPIIALTQSYFYFVGLYFLPNGVHMDSDALVHITVVMNLCFL